MDGDLPSIINYLQYFQMVMYPTQIEYCIIFPKSVLSQQSQVKGCSDMICIFAFQ